MNVNIIPGSEGRRNVKENALGSGSKSQTNRGERQDSGKSGSILNESV